MKDGQIFVAFSEYLKSNCGRRYEKKSYDAFLICDFRLYVQLEFQILNEIYFAEFRKLCNGM